ncbi:MAG TPA: hypothetical protein DHW49_06820 [Anaerolineae bacterium]|nr:hypothetical protein [Anaerolineae bacterium]
MNNAIDEKRKKRFQYLHALYEFTDGDQLKDINFLELGHNIGLTDEESDKISNYLANEGLIKFIAAGYITIEHNGVIEIENALSRPNNETTYFPPASLIIIGNVSNSNIQQGDNNQIRQINYLSDEIQLEIQNLLKELREKTVQLKLTQENQKELEAEIQTIEIQSKSPKPKQVIIKESLISLKTILESITGNIVADVLLKKITELL